MVQTKSTNTHSLAGSTSVFKAAGVMGAATFLSRILGLVREQVFAVFFGAGNVMDAFNVAFRIPNLLRDLFAEGAMSASLVPTFTKVRIEQGDRRAWRVAGLVFRVLFVFVSILALVGIFFAPQIVQLYAESFDAVPGKFNLTVLLTRVMFPFFPLVALGAAFMGILNACGKYFIPALSSAVFNVTSILTGGVLTSLFFNFPHWGFEPILGMAIGVVVGGGAQALCQLPVLLQVGYSFSSRSRQDPPWMSDPALRKMLWMMLPGTVGLAATQINLLVNTVLATQQGTGAVSWLNYAFRLMQFPIGIFGVSLAQATLPKISALWIQGQITETKQVLVDSVKLVLAINIFASAGLIFLGEPIIQLIFEYGRFTAIDTQQTALALAAYSSGLAAYSLVKVLVPVCYAFGNAKMPVISSILSVGLTIGLNLVLVKPFGYWGLALGTSIAAVFNALVLIYFIEKTLRKNKASLNLFSLFSSLALYLILAVVMGVFSKGTWIVLSSGLRSVWKVVSQAEPESSYFILALMRGFSVFTTIFLAIAFVILLGRLLKVQELVQVSDLFLKKFRNLSRNT